MTVFLLHTNIALEEEKYKLYFYILRVLRCLSSGSIYDTYYFSHCEMFTPTLLSILADLWNIGFYIVPIVFLVSSYSILFSKPFSPVQRTPTKTDSNTILTLMLDFFFWSLIRSKYLYRIPLSFIFTLLSNRTAKCIR